MKNQRSIYQCMGKYIFAIIRSIIAARYFKSEKRDWRLFSSDLMRKRRVPGGEKWTHGLQMIYICILALKITDAKSGLIRRLVDVSPSGNKLGPKEYKTIMKQIEFELGAIAYHCQEIYLKNPGMYDDYIPIAMLGASNDFYNFIVDSYHVFKRERSLIPLKYKNRVLAITKQGKCPKVKGNSPLFS